MLVLRGPLYIWKESCKFCVVRVVCVRTWGSLSFIPARAKIYPFRIPVGHSAHQKCFTAPAKSIFLLKTREPYGPCMSIRHCVHG